MPQYFGSFLPSDFSRELTGIGSLLGEVKKRNQLSNAFANFDGDYTKAANQLMQMGRVDEAMKLYTAGQLAQYRDIQGQVALNKAEPSFEEKLLAPYLPGAGNVEPFRLEGDGNVAAGMAAEEAEAAGLTAPPTQRPSLENAPKKVQDILGSNQQIKQWEKEGEGAGARASFRKALVEASPQAQGLIDRLLTQAQEADNDTFENAVGPWQGGPDAETLSGALGQGIAQTAGALNNWYQQGTKDPSSMNADPNTLPGGFTSTVRSNINSTSATLINILQRALRVPGIGAQSDAELRQLIAQAGDLTKAKTKADYFDRLSNVVANMNSLGFNVNVPGAKEFADRLTPESEVPAVNKVKTVTIRPDGSEEPTEAAASVGGQTIPGATRDPRGPYNGPPPPGTVARSPSGHEIIMGADGKWHDRKTGKALR